MKRSFELIAMTGLYLSICALGLKAQSCSGNGEIGGSYAFVGSRANFPSVSVGPPGTSGTGSSGTSGSSTGSTNGVTGSTSSVTVSNTPIGQLIGGMSGSSPFAAVGRVVADGAGNLLGSQSPTGALISVGSYTVNQDCTISVTLNDAFVGMPVTPPGTAGNGSTSIVGSSGSGSGVTSTNETTPASIKLVGVVLDRGAEVDLIQTGTSTTGASNSGASNSGASNTGTSSSTGVSNTGAVITLRRAVQFTGCTDANLTGAFGLVAQATIASASPGSATNPGVGGTNSSLGASSTIGRLVANGAGTFLADTPAMQSPLQDLQFTGTYAVADDCSGTAKFTDSSGTMHNIEFVIVQSENSSSTPGLQTALPELLFSFTDEGVTGTGFARHE
jgi:hypothetical protein